MEPIFKNLKFGTLNLRSINCGDQSIKNTLNKFDFLIKESKDVYFLTEVKAFCKNRLNEVVNYLEFHSKIQYKIIFNSTSRSRGTAIMYKKNLAPQIVSVLKSNDENYIAVNLVIQKTKLTLICIYAPNNCGIDFFRKIDEFITSCNNEFIIIGGDWNLTLSNLAPSFNPDLEFHPTACNQIGSNYLDRWIVENNFIDPFRSIWGDKRCFSFEKKYPTHVSRSRIDFFLVSTNLKTFLTDSEYTRTPAMFDHLLCSFTLNNQEKMSNKIPWINPEILSSEEFKRQCALESLNFINENYTDAPQNVRLALQQLNKLNGDIINLDKIISINFDLMLFEIRKHKINEFNDLYNPIADSIQGWVSNNDTSPSLLLLALVNNLRNIACGLTAAKFRANKNIIKQLESKLEFLRANDPNNNMLIDEISEKLNTMANLEAEGLFFKSNKFYSRYFEKDTHALSNAINKVCSTPLTVLTNENGDKFNSTSEQSDYIADYYKSLYSTPAQSNLSCDDFLEGCETPKLNENECDYLSNDFTYTELDKIMKKLNFKSSPGIDGISNHFIKAIYFIIKPFMLRAYNSVKNGLDEVPKEFKTAYIKLIPKKSNLTQIKNWRPISLSSNLYKIYCKLWAERMKDVLPSLLGVSQKAYTNTFNISDATINTIFRIAKSNVLKKPMFTVAIDFMKAFDRVSHSFIFKMLKKFGFPDLFINVIVNWLKDRKAAIKLQSGYSKFFEIFVGTPQGDPLSGYIFILCMEILSIKINSYEALKVDLDLDLQQNNNSVDECFADDINTFTPATDFALKLLLDILQDFENLSGLSINKDKTYVMITGVEPNDLLINIITSNGFKYATQITHLGIKIDNKLNSMDVNWLEKIKKTECLKNLFLSIKPSLNCKIEIVKTFILSQFTYIAAILDPSPEVIKTIEDLIINFLFPGFNLFPKSRIFTKVEHGGLGIPNIKIFFESLKIKTASRIHNSKQLWAAYSRNFFFNKCVRFISKNLPEENIINSLIKSLDEFNRIFFSDRVRIWSNNVFYSSIVKNTELRTQPLTIPNHLSEIPNIYNLTVRDIVNPSTKRTITYGQLINKTESNFDYNFYYKVVTAVRAAVLGFRFDNDEPRNCSIAFLYSKNPKSSTFRKYLKVDLNNITEYSSYINYDNIYPAPFNERQSKHFYSMWKWSFLPSNIKNFTLKRINGKVLLNHQLSRFNNAIHPYCSNCFRYPLTILPTETNSHFFYSCPISKRIIEEYFQNIFDCELDIAQVIFKGHLADNNYEICYINIEMALFLFFLFNCKLYKKIPSLGYISTSIAFTKKVMINTSVFYRNTIEWIKKNKNGKIKDHFKILEIIP